MSPLNQARGGKDYDAEFTTRMTGTGAYADLLRTRFELARRRCGFDDAGAGTSSRPTCSGRRRGTDRS